jgi:hypothetical protein
MNPNPKKNTPRGSVLSIVLITASVLGIITASFFRYALAETRISRSNLLMNEARYAAESVAEHGMSQLHTRFLREAAVAPWEFDPTRTISRPLILTTDLYNLYASVATSRVLLPEAPFNAANLLANPTGLVAGVSPANSVVAVIDRAIPGNEITEHLGSRVDLREIEIYAHATVEDTRFGQRTAYVRQRFQILEDSLFSYGIFYEGDMTLSPGPTMTFAEGSVHSNGNIWLGANNVLNIQARLTTAGFFQLGREDDNRPFGSGTTSGTVRILNALSNNLINLNVSISDAEAGGAGLGLSGWLQSGRPNFRDLASSVLGGNLQTDEHGVSRRSPVGFEEMGELFAAGVGNFGYHMIMPPANRLDLTDPTLSADEQAILQTVEAVKLSTRVGLTLELSFDSSGVPLVELYRFERDANGDLLYAADGSPRTEPVTLPASMEFWEIETFARSGDTVLSGLYDFREGNNNRNVHGEKSLVRIDVERMADYLEADPDLLDASGNRIFDTHPHPSGFYNGGIYMRMPEQPNPNRADLVRPAMREWAIDLYNGERVPNPDYLRSPSADAPAYGMTLATNGPLYVTGNFNVPDGVGSSSAPADPVNFGRQQGAEAAVALAADAVTILSSDFNRFDSRRDMSGAIRRAGHTTISAAIISGVVRGGSSDYSGGVENFPRFLENWDSRDAIMRGAFISLFESEVNTGNWRYGGRVYTAPRRNWGYNNAFLTETRPPIFRSLRGYRQVYFEELSRDQYEAGVNDLLAAFNAL